MAVGPIAVRIPALMILLDPRLCTSEADWERRVRVAVERVEGEPAVVRLRGATAAQVERLGRPAPRLAWTAADAAARGFSWQHWPEAVVGQHGPTPPAIASAHDLAGLRRAAAAGARAALVAPILAPRSKPGVGMGLDGLAALAAASPLPVLALGGLEPEHADALAAAGAVGLAALTPFHGPGLPEALDRWLDASRKFQTAGGDR